MPKKIDLSIIVLSYNTRELLDNCLDSLANLRNELSFEVIVVDNASTDASAEMVSKEYPWIKLVKNETNLGFAAGNNRARKHCKADHILFLNSDTIVYKNTLKRSLDYLKTNPEIGALTCKLILPNGSLDKDVRRSFISPWIGMTHIFFKMDKIFPHSAIFGRYWYGYISPDKVHDADVIQGAYFLTRKKVLDRVGWFDEDYFLDGEDIDICWKIKRNGWRIVYYPKVSILHVKAASKGKNKQTKNKIALSEKLKYSTTGVDSMEIFYRKHQWNNYPWAFNIFVLSGIRLLKTARMAKVIILG